jgi:hypothetical protein
MAKVSIHQANHQEFSTAMSDYRKLIRSEAGNQEPCPMCGASRVLRSDYLRCLPCGVNWLEGEDRSKHPGLERSRKMIEELKNLPAPTKR